MEALKMNYKYEQAILYLNDKENVLNRNIKNRVISELIEIVDELDNYTVEIEDIDDLMTFIQYRLAEVQAIKTTLNNCDLTDYKKAELMISQIKSERKLQLGFERLAELREWRCNNACTNK